MNSEVNNFLYGHSYSNVLGMAAGLGTAELTQCELRRSVAIDKTIAVICFHKAKEISNF